MSKTTKIGDRIKVLKGELGVKSDRQLEKGNLPGEQWVISNGLLSKWEDKTVDFASTTLDEFLNYWNVNRVWWKTGEGAVLNEKPTHDDIEPAIPQKPEPDHLDEVLNKVESSPNYFVIPKVVLRENYRLVALEQFQLDKDKLEKERDEMKRQAEKDRVYLDAQIEANRDLSRKLDALIAKLTEVQKSQ